ncbi:COQ9 family protein [Abyssibius alkaniclasticus]|uniref:COQ9 family protein n=1 Tax=Abyssibius alkaniclasticus TaxID=2881234 RepID=UPI0023637399|nr:COQ9 family protein [Abyssibius alkaniclasticus]UPH71881.1 COQ9 family protein [Abyssibius alkaniclasticus]
MMPAKPKSEADHIIETRKAVIAAALPHVVFDGWSAATLAEAVADSGVDAGLAALAFPRGAVDLALAFHFAGDAEMRAQMAQAEFGALRYRDRVARAIAIRLQIAAPHKEAVRRGMALFALPQHAADGARAVWHTADAIWDGLGDGSRDVNWYTKRMTLGAVYSACLLFWLGDEDGSETPAFIDRRIEDVMRFEKAKAAFRNSGMGKLWAAGPGKILGQVQAPSPQTDMPGYTGPTHANTET